MPAPSSDFRLYHSNSLEVLAGLLATELRTTAPGQSLLAPDIVLIPQVAMRRWLQATLAAEHGIAANLEFLTPGEFVARALEANVPGAAEDLGADALHWQLYAALTDSAVLRESSDAAVAALSGRRQRAEAMVAGRRAGHGVREIPGLAPRLAAGLGSRAGAARSAGRAVAAHRQRSCAPRPAHRQLPGELRPRRPRRRRAAAHRPAVAPVRLRHPQRVARRVAGHRHPGAGRHAAFLHAHADRVRTGATCRRWASACARRPTIRSPRSMRKPVAAGLGRGRPRLHRRARQL